MFPPAAKAFDAKRIAACGRALLQAVMVASGVTLAARAMIGPFHFLVPVTSPINAESFFALSAVLLMVVNVARGDPPGSSEPNITVPPGPTPKVANRRTNLLDLTILSGTCVAAWIWICRFPFVADDYQHIANALRASPAYLAGLFTVAPADHFFRPFGYLAYAAEARWFGASLMAWHGFSILLHLANTALIHALALRRGFSRRAALGAALFFALSGARPEAVAWIGAQFDLWATMFFLLAWLALQREAEAGSWVWKIVEAGALILALLSKESAYVFPLVALVTLWMDGARGRALVRRLVTPVVITLAMFAYRWHVLGGIGGYRMAGSGTSFFYSVSLYRTGKALLLRLPAILCFPINWTDEPQWWLVALLIAAMVVLGLIASVRARGRGKELCFAICVLFVTAIPVHQFLLIGPDLEKSRVLYLPSVGFALLLAVGFDAMRPKWAVGAMCAVLAFQAAALEHNLFIWRDVADLVERTCASVAVAGRSGPLTVSDVPNVVDGVYFLHTGFRPCVEWAAGKSARDLSISDESPSLVWNPKVRAFVPSPYRGQP